jgi:hypothetical protein
MPTLPSGHFTTSQDAEIALTNFTRSKEPALRTAPAAVSTSALTATRSESPALVKLDVVASMR